MTDAETILKLIETVDPGDRAKLDELDIVVHRFLHGSVRPIIEAYLIKPVTRSRDALKYIRPEGWVFEQKISGNHNVYWAKKYNQIGGCLKLVGSNPLGALLLSEELAELHAIIQAIAHERGQ